LDQEHILKDLDLYPRYLPFEVLTFFAETGNYAQGGFQMMDRDLGAISV